MIKKFNAWMEKVGVDKLLHFFVAAWVVAECKYFGLTAMLIGLLNICTLSVIKELWMD